MDDFGALLSKLKSDDALELLGKAVNAKPNQVEQLAKLALPTLVTALNRNASTPDGAEALDKALDQHQGIDISDLSGFLKGVDTQDGTKIIGHLLGKKTQTVEKQLAVSSGLDITQVAGLLSQFAPLIMAYLGQQKQEKKTTAKDLTGITSGLGTLLGGESNDLLGMASKLLDSDGDGDVTDDIGKLLGGFLKK